MQPKILIQSSLMTLAIILSSPLLVRGQISKPQADLEKRINDLEKAMAIIAPPNRDTTILAGQIHVNHNNPVITFNIPASRVQNSEIPAGVDEHTGRVIFGARYYSDTIRTVNFINVGKVNLHFDIPDWKTGDPDIIITVGNIVSKIPAGTNPVIIPNATFGGKLICSAVSASPIPSAPVPITSPHEYYFNSLQFPNTTAHFAIVTVPVIPVKIVYAPPTDINMQNSASSKITTTSSYVTGVTFTYSNGSTTTSSAMTDISSLISDIGAAASVITDVNASGAGAILQQLLGSQTNTKTITSTVINQQFITQSVSDSYGLKTDAHNGGPGEGDAFLIHINAKFAVFNYNGVTTTTFVGYDEPYPPAPSAHVLKAKLAALLKLPAGTLDPEYKITAEAFRTLLALDPFTGPGGAFTDPQGPSVTPGRFGTAINSYTNEPTYNSNGVTIPVQLSYSTNTADQQTKSTMMTYSQVDHAGALSWLFGGDDNSSQYSVTQTYTSQTLTGNSLADSVTFNGINGDNYACEVYFDKTFGSFAFQDITDIFDGNNAVQGIAKDGQNKILPNMVVFATISNRSFVTKTDAQGAFFIRLPKNLSMPADKKISFQVKGQRSSTAYIDKGQLIQVSAGGPGNSSKTSSVKTN